MTLVNVSRVIKSKRLAQPFGIYRKTGSWVDGRWVGSEVLIPFSGVVTVANANDITQVPEGDRASGVMVFHSIEQMFVTHDDADGKGTSDEAFWHGERYRFFNVFPLDDYGYYKAIGVKMGGK